MRTRHEIQSHDRNQTAASDRMRERIDAFSSRRPRPIEISGKPSVMLLFFAPRLGVKYGSIRLPAAKATIEATLVSWQSSSPNRFSVLRNEFPPGGSATGESFPRSLDDANLGRGPDGLRRERRSFPGHRRASSRGSVSVKSAWERRAGPILTRHRAASCITSRVRVRVIAAAPANKVEILKVSL